jgi:hypothetical protein
MERIFRGWLPCFGGPLTLRRTRRCNAIFPATRQWQRVRLPTDASRYLEFRQNFKEGLRKAGLPEE